MPQKSTHFNRQTIYFGHFNPFFQQNCHANVKNISEFCGKTLNLKFSHKANFLDMTLKLLTQYLECIVIVK